MLASGALVGQHLFKISLPGCSAGGLTPSGGSGTSISGNASPPAPASACASLEAHPLGSIGGMWIGLKSRLDANPVPKITLDQAVWPMSFLGFAYFTGACIGWLVIARFGRGVPLAVRVLVWLGVLISVAYVAVIVLDRKFCQYCITSHAANLGLLLSMEIGFMFQTARTRTPAHTSPNAPATKIIASALLGFAAVSLAMGALEHTRRESVRAAGEQAAAQSASELQAKIEADKKAAAVAQTQADLNPWPEGFKARWALGPAQAPVRVVILSSYQCPDCKRIEGEAFELLAKYPGTMSVGFMHFPLNADCNKFVSKDAPPPHPNSCWAARAAETAGMLQGADGFWKMHKWLFEKSGTFTNQEIRDGVKSLGFDEALFLKLMQESPLPMQNIEADVTIGHKLGLYFTPMVFVNGVEMRGWNVPGTLVRTVDQVMQQNPPALTALVDKPVLASQKYIDDWTTMPVQGLPVERDGRSVGPTNALVRITIFGDYAEPNTREAWNLIKPMATDPANSVRVTYRHFPGDQSCNPSLPKTFFANGCLAARAAEAAGIPGGVDDFWKMHDWLMSLKTLDTLSVNEIKRGANTLGFDSGKIESLIESAEVTAAVAKDIAAAQQSGVRQIPQIYVNGKFVQRWVREGDNVMQRIVDEAKRQVAPPPPPPAPAHNASDK